MFRFFVSIPLSVLSIIALFVSCNDNPAAPQTPSVVGHWVGMKINTVLGHSEPDTLQIDLNITADKKYTLARRSPFYTSTTIPIMDSAWEQGAWQVNGSNLLLTPSECKIYDLGTGEMVDNAGCAGTTKTITIAISGNAWEITLPEWKNGELITYPTRKL